MVSQFLFFKIAKETGSPPVQQTQARSLATGAGTRNRNLTSFPEQQLHLKLQLVKQAHQTRRKASLSIFFTINQRSPSMIKIRTFIFRRKGSTPLLIAFLSGLVALVVRDLLHWRINALTSSLPQLAQGRPREMATRPGHCLSESNVLGSKWLFKPSYFKEYHASRPD